MRGAMSSTKGTLPEKVLVQLAETAPDAAVRRTATGALKSIAWILLIIAVIVIAWRVITGRRPV